MLAHPMPRSVRGGTGCSRDGHGTLRAGEGIGDRVPNLCLGARTRRCGPARLVAAR